MEPAFALDAFAMRFLQPGRLVGFPPRRLTGEEAAEALSMFRHSGCDTHDLASAFETDEASIQRALERARQLEKGHSGR